MEDWRPIETARRNGERIWVYPPGRLSHWTTQAPPGRSGCWAGDWTGEFYLPIQPEPRFWLPFVPPEETASHER